MLSDFGVHIILTCIDLQCLSVNSLRLLSTWSIVLLSDSSPASAISLSNGLSWFCVSNFVSFFTLDVCDGWGGGGAFELGPGLGGCGLGGADTSLFCVVSCDEV